MLAQDVYRDVPTKHKTLKERCMRQSVPYIIIFLQLD